MKVLASDELTDEIASIQMHRHEIEKESGAAAARDYALPRLRELLRLEQEAQQRNGPGENGPANLAALNAAISKLAAPSPGNARAAGGNRPPQRHEAHRQPPQESHGRRRKRRAGRNPGR